MRRRIKKRSRWILSPIVCLYKQRREVIKNKYFVTILKCIFQVPALKYFSFSRLFILIPNIYSQISVLSLPDIGKALWLLFLFKRLEKVLLFIE